MSAARMADGCVKDACNFYGRQSVYDDHGGIALAQEEGAAIAKALGTNHSVAILQNHGFVFYVAMIHLSRTDSE